MLDDSVTRAPTPLGAKIDGDPRWYHPERDISVIGPELLRKVASHFETVPHPDEYYRMLMEGTPDAECRQHLANGVMSLARFLNSCHKGDANCIKTAAEEAGLLRELPIGIRAALMSRLGEVMLGGIYSAMQDITPMGGEPPQARSLAALVDMADAFANRLLAPIK